MAIKSNYGIQQVLAIVLLCVLSSGQATAAGISKWVDANGKTHYGTQPPAGAMTTAVRKPATVDYHAPADQAEIVLYSTSWCGYCRKARAYMNQNNITFVEKDIEKDRRAKAKYDQLGGRGVPFLVRDESDTLRGFNVRSYRQFFATGG